MDVVDFNYRTTGSNVMCPQILISARITDSVTQTDDIEDLRESEGRQVLFPDVISSLTADERQKVIQAIVDVMIQIYLERHG